MLESGAGVLGIQGKLVGVIAGVCTVLVAALLVDGARQTERLIARLAGETESAVTGPLVAQLRDALVRADAPRLGRHCDAALGHGGLVRCAVYDGNDALLASAEQSAGASEATVRSLPIFADDGRSLGRVELTLSDASRLGAIRQVRSRVLRIGGITIVFAALLAWLASQFVLAGLRHLANEAPKSIENATPVAVVSDDLVGGVTKLLNQVIAQVGEIRGSRDWLAEATEAMPQAIFILHPDRTVRMVNDAGARLLGRHRTEIIGQMASRFLVGPISLDARLDQAVTTGGVVDEPLSMRTVSGGEVPIRLNASRLGSPDDVTGYVISAADARGAAEMIDRLEQARAAAEAASVAKGDFLANVSHELRTPLNGVIGMTDLALQTNLTAEQRDLVETARGSAGTLLDLVNDILDFSKVEAGKLELISEGIDLHQICEETLRTLAMRAHTKGVELVCDIDLDDPMVVVGDPTRIRQVLANLVSNAVKFTDHGEIVVQARYKQLEADRVQLEVTVRDSGIGIPLERQQDIFEAFVQVGDSAVKREAGTGLGLVISARLAQMMSGAISVQSEVGKGSTFTFTAWLGVGTSDLDPSSQPPLPGLVHVLVVDDNDANRRVLERMLTRMGAEVMAVDSFDGAMDAVRSSAGRYELALIDHAIGQRSGVELVEQVGRECPDLELPMLMMVPAYDAKEIEGLGHAGRRGYLTKPVRRDDLFASLRRSSSIVALPPAPNTRANAIRPLRVLLAEDNPVNQRVTQKVLEQAGHRVEVVETGKAAVEQWSTGSFDVILMDVQMPGMDGLEATWVIRSREVTSGSRTPIIALTAYAQPEDRQRCLDVGMDGYLSKPLDAIELIQALNKVATGAVDRAPSSGVGEDVRPQPNLHIQVSSVLTPAPSLVGHSPMPGGATPIANVLPGFSDDDEMTDRLSAHQPLLRPLPSRAPVRLEDAGEPCIFDRAGALRQCRGDESLLAEIVTMFAGEYPSAMSSIRAAIEGRDAIDLTYRAHSLKGMASSVGGSALSVAAGRLESMARAGDLSQAPVAFSALQAELDRFVSALSSAS